MVFSLDSGLKSVGGLTTPDILVDSLYSIYLGLGDILWKFIVILKYKSPKHLRDNCGHVLLAEDTLT